MDSTQGVVCLQYVLVQGVNITCLVLATECFTKNVACNLQLVSEFPYIMLMQFLNLTFTFWGQGILSIWKLNIGDLSIH